MKWANLKNTKNIRNTYFHPVTLAMMNLTSVVQNKMTGAVFTRWGRTTCPPTAELVYAGMWTKHKSQ